MGLLAVFIWLFMFALLMTGRNLEHAYFALRKLRLSILGKKDMSRAAQQKRRQKKQYNKEAIGVVTEIRRHITSKLFYDAENVQYIDYLLNQLRRSK